MKKIMVLAVAMFAMATATFAAEEETNATAAYNMNVKMSSLADALSLNIDQVEAVADVHKNFTADMMNAAHARYLEQQSVSQVRDASQHNPYQPWFEVIIFYR